MKGAATLLAILCVAATLAYEPDPVPADDLVVVTFNVHQWYAEDDGAANVLAVRDALAAIDADIIVLQETEGARITSQVADPVRWLAWSLHMHHHAGAPMSEQSYNVAILSKNPLIDAQVVWLPALDSIERLAVTATVDTIRGPVFLIATHFQTDVFPDDRTRQAAAVRDLASQTEHPVILAGDLNTEPADDPAWILLNQTFEDHWTDGPGYTSEAGSPARRIDHIMTRGIAPSQMWTFGGPEVSDHLGVAARF